MTATESVTLLEINKKIMRKGGSQNTKIVATVGPACSSYENLLELVRTGVDIFRLNFSHGSHADHLAVIQHIVAINEEYKTHIGILADLQGPKLRVGNIKDNALPLKTGDVITIVNDKTAEGTMDRIYMSYPEFAEVFREKGGFDEFQVEVLDLNEFMEWLDDFEKEKMKIAVFPTPDFQSAVMTPERLRADFQAEFDKEQE